MPALNPSGRIPLPGEVLLDHNAILMLMRQKAAAARGFKSWDEMQANDAKLAAEQQSYNAGKALFDRLSVHPQDPQFAARTQESDVSVTGPGQQGRARSLADLTIT